MSNAFLRKTRKREENLLFLKRLLKNPVSVGAVVPSSAALANFICRQVKCLPGEYVVELGAGTGRFTQALIDHGMSVEQIIAIEVDPELANFLRGRFPNLIVIEGDATQLQSLLPPHVIGHVRTILSGIPMVNMPKDILKAIVKSAFATLVEEGVFLQFTYGPISPLPSRKLGLSQKRLGHILLNFPPATVWAYRRCNKEGERVKQNFVKTIRNKLEHKLERIKKNNNSFPHDHS